MLGTPQWVVARKYQLPNSYFCMREVAEYRKGLGANLVFNSGDENPLHLVNCLSQLPI